MKLLLSSLLLSVVLFSSCENCCSKKEKEQSKNEISHETKKEKHTGKKHNMKLPDDGRISLNVTGKRAKHQLINMRDHVVAVNLILNHLSKNEFEEASTVALDKLGPSKHMMMMCSAFDNKEFEELGFAFHESAKTMSEIIKTKDLNKSLEALTVTTGYCVSCHAKFKQ